MKRVLVVSLAAGALLVAGAIPLTASAGGLNPDTPPGPSKNWVACWQQDGTFQVVHNNDTIDGIAVKQGQWNIWVKGASCGSASNKFHKWLGTTKSSNSWDLTCLAAFKNGGDGALCTGDALKTLSASKVKQQGKHKGKLKRIVFACCPSGK